MAWHGRAWRIGEFARIITGGSNADSQAGRFGGVAGLRHHPRLHGPQRRPRIHRYRHTRQRRRHRRAALCRRGLVRRSPRHADPRRRRNPHCLRSLAARGCRRRAGRVGPGAVSRAPAPRNRDARAARPSAANIRISTATHAGARLSFDIAPVQIHGVVLYGVLISGSVVPVAHMAAAPLPADAPRTAGV